jgi:hypothetical protein
VTLPRPAPPSVRLVILADAESPGEWPAGQGRRSRSHATACKAALDAVAANRTIGSEDDGPSSAGLPAK